MLLSKHTKSSSAFGRDLIILECPFHASLPGELISEVWAQVFVLCSFPWHSQTMRNWLIPHLRPSDIMCAWGVVQSPHFLKHLFTRLPSLHDCYPQGQKPWSSCSLYLQSLLSSWWAFNKYLLNCIKLTFFLKVFSSRFYLKSCEFSEHKWIIFRLAIILKNCTICISFPLCNMQVIRVRMRYSHSIKKFLISVLYTLFSHLRFPLHWYILPSEPCSSLN